VDEFLSTTQVGWLLGRSTAVVRRMIRDGEIEGVRLPSGYRVRREEALRVSREWLEKESGRQLSDEEVERLAEEVLTRNADITES
jgi:excisionase family DNA binding protein